MTARLTAAPFQPTSDPKGPRMGRLMGVIAALGGRAACLALVAACAATSPKVTIDAVPRAMYEEMVRDIERRGGSGKVFPDGMQRQDLREAELLRRIDEDGIRSAEDHFYAGAILVRSGHMESLLQAESLGRRAAILGDKRGNVVAAEAVDRQAFITGAPQRYGTQYAYNALTGNWQLYLVDPEVTDEQRQAAGMPNLAWFQGRVDLLNESNKSDRLREELRLPPTR